MNIDLESVQQGKEAATLTAEALRLEISRTVTSTDRIPLRAKRIEAVVAAQDLDELEIRINAGQTAIPRLMASQIVELQDLSRKLDRQIVSAKLLTFALSAAGEILDSAVRVKDLVKGNLG